MKGALFSRPKKEYRDYADILNCKYVKPGTKISPWRFRLPYYLLSTYFSAVAGVCAHKTTPFMQNKANFQRPANDCNLSSNKHLRRKTTPASAKKQSQFKTNRQKDRDPCQTSPNTSYQFRSTLLRAYKAPLAGVPSVQATRAHKTTPFMQNKANFQRHDNECNLSSNKHLRTQTTPSTTKKQSQFKTNWQKGRDPCQTSPNTSYQFRATLLRAYKAPLAGVPPLQAPRRAQNNTFYAKQSQFPEAC